MKKVEMKIQKFDTKAFKDTFASKQYKAASELLLLLNAINDTFRDCSCIRLTVDNKTKAKLAVAIIIYEAIEKQKEPDWNCTLETADWQDIEGIKDCWRGAVTVYDVFENLRNIQNSFDMIKTTEEIFIYEDNNI